MGIADDIRNKLNIVDVISEYVHLEKKGKDYKGLCPFHNEKTPSFSVSEDKQLFYCFGCQTGGDIIKFVSEYEHLSYYESMELLAKRAGIPFNEKASSKNQEEYLRKKRLFEMYKSAALFYVSALYGKADAAKAYLDKRGLDKATATLFGLGYAPNSPNALYLYLKSKEYDDALMMKSGLFKLNNHGRINDLFKNRLMFPILDKRSNVIAFGGRALEDSSNPKYLNSPETDIFSKKNNLYGIHLAAKSKQGYFIACEGYMDVIALNAAGYNNAVASLGTALTVQQLRLIRNYTDSLYLMYDSDNAGYAAIKRAVPLAVTEGLFVKVVDLSPHKDPDELIKQSGVEEMNVRIENAQNPIFFQGDTLYSKVSVSDPESKVGFYNALVELITEIPDVILRSSYIEAAAVRYSLDKELLKAQVDKLGYSREVKSLNSQERHRDRQAISPKNEYSTAQALMLAWISDDAQVYRRVCKLLTPSDFTSPLFKRIYEQIGSAIEDGRDIDFGGLMDGLEGDESSLVSGILTGGSEFAEYKNKDVALKELIIRIKTESYNSFKQNMTDAVLGTKEKLSYHQQLMDMKKQLEELKSRELP